MVKKQIQKGTILILSFSCIYWVYSGVIMYLSENRIRNGGFGFFESFFTEISASVLAERIGTVFILILLYCLLCRKGKESSETDGESCHLGKNETDLLQQNNKKYQLIFEHAPLGIFYFDDRGVIREANEKFIDILGTDKDVLVGFNMSERLQDPKMQEAVNTALSGGIGSYEGVYASVTGKKSSFIRSIFTGIYDENGTWKVGIGIVEDISLRVKALEELQKLKDNLEDEVDRKTKELISAQEKVVQSERLAAIGKLGGTLAHEFRNQLGVMRNVSYYLKMKLGDKDEKILRHLKILEDEIIQTDSIIESILAFSRVKELKLEEFDIKDMINSVMEKMKDDVSSDVELTVDYHNLSSSIKADRVQLNHILYNLISNSYEAIESHGKINISVSDDNDNTYFLIEDNGSGIKKEQLDSIMEPLFTTKARGTGLGLPTVKMLVERHNGSLSIESEPGKGTVVKICLPKKIAKTKTGEL